MQTEAGEVLAALGAQAHVVTWGIGAGQSLCGQVFVPGVQVPGVSSLGGHGQ
jgi:hypothetical protein